MANGEETESNRIVACEAARDKAYLAANAVRAAAHARAFGVAKEDYRKVLVAARAAAAAAANTAEAVHAASIENADAEYSARRLAK